MSAELRADGAEQDLANLIDDIVPSHGYGKVPVVGLGGSAGSIEALQEFFSTMPPHTGLAFVVVIHLSPDHDSALTDVIQRCTRMPVVQVHHTLAVQPDTVYVIPPGSVLQSEDGELKLAAIPQGRGKHVAVDVFFRTLADSHGAHAAAVVLSGLDGDGSIGIKRIKERGGLTVAQDPDHAQHDSMPRHAIATGMVDWVLPVRDMPGRLLAYFRLEEAVELPPEEPPAEGPSPSGSGESELRDVLSFLRTRTGRDFTQYKRATVLRRIGRRMQVNGVDNLAGYLNCLRTRSGEAAELLQDLLISVTNFFRDPECFDALAAQVPALFQGKGPNDVVRAWVVACATGEEPYSVAMLLCEHARTLDAPPLVQVFATELDEVAVQTAREGVYPATIEADVSEDRLRRFFQKEHRGYRVRRELREMVLFAVHDVLHDSPFSRQDLISCRNLLIYLSRDAQRRIFDTFHFALLPKARLFLGSSESVEEGSPLFTPVDKKHRLYAQRPSTRAVIPLPPTTSNLLRPFELPQPARSAAGNVFDDDGSPADGLGQHRARPVARHGAWSELHLMLVEQLAPPSVLVNADYDIVHLSGSAGRFLHLAGGEPSRSLLHALQPDLRMDLRAALYQASHHGKEVEVPAVALPVGGGTVMTGLRVVPTVHAGETLFLVLFEARSAEGESNDAKTARLAADPIARYLDAEIERLKAHLRETVEQYEASTEELKASNEELQAMNEEMRAAAEELETSREELQSINEELVTVNHELKAKIDELSHANSDMQNLMDATQIATVFLDRELRITRYTPSAVGLFNLIPGDVGRPLTDMATQLQYPGLGADAQRVLDRLAPIEREVGQSGGSWYLARLMPYRTMDDRIAGVVITFIDITERKQAGEVRMWLAAVVNSTSDGIISFAPDETILSWNSGAHRLFGYTAEEAIGQPLSMLSMLYTRDAEEHARMLRDVVAGRNVEQIDTLRRRRDGSEVHVALTASPIRDGSGKVVAGTVIVRDISAQRAAAEALRQSEERLRLIFENAVEYAIFSTDLERRITSWNKGAERVLGLSEQEALGQPADIIFTPEDRAAQAPEKEAGTARREGRAADERVHLRKDGSRFRGTGIAMLMRNQAGEAVGFLKVLRDLSGPQPDPQGR